MKDNLCALLALAGVLISAPLYAEDVSKKAFDGWGAQVALGIGGAQSDMSTQYSEDLQLIHISNSSWLWFLFFNSRTDITETASYSDSLTISDNNVKASLGASYARSMQSYSLGVSAFYQLGSQNYGAETLPEITAYAQEVIRYYNLWRTNQSASTSTDTGIITGQVHLKQLHGIVLEPGYYLQDNWLAYLKLGAAWTKPELQVHGDFSVDVIGTPPDYTEASAGTLDTTVKFGSTVGFLYGIGTKYALSENLYIGAEAYQVRFPTQTETTDFVGPWDDYGEATYGNADTTTTYTFKTTYNYAGVVVGYQF